VEAHVDARRMVDPTVHARRWWILAVLGLSLLIVFVGNASLNVVLPTLARTLHATTSQLQWVVAVYSLVFAGLLFSTGALGDRFGRKGILQLGLLLFLVAAALAACSDSMWQLIACRGVMGAAAAMVMPSTLSILVNVFPPHERAKAIAIWASLIGVAGSLGPIASGFLLGHFWYGSVFLVNVPIVLVALLSGWFLVPKSKDPDQAGLDPMGATLSVVGIASLVFGLIEAPDKGWLSAPTLAAFAVAAAVLVLFVLWERRVDEPMLDIGFFRNPAFSTGTAGMILVFLALYGLMFLLTQYFQLVKGLSPLAAALRFLPMAPVMLIVAPLTPHLSHRFGANRAVAGGMTLVAVALFLFRFVGVHTSYAYVLACLMCLTTGMSSTMSPMTAAIMSAVPSRRAGAGSAMNDATRELGSALGVAVLGSVAASRYASRLHHVVAGLSPTARSAARSSLASVLNSAKQLAPADAGAVRAGALRAYMDGIHVSVTAGAMLAAVAALVVLRFLPRQLAQEGALHGPIESLEDAAELVIGGVPPLFGDLASEEPGRR